MRRPGGSRIPGDPVRDSGQAPNPRINSAPWACQQVYNHSVRAFPGTGCGVLRAPTAKWKASLGLESAEVVYDAADRSSRGLRDFRDWPDPPADLQEHTHHARG